MAENRTDSLSSDADDASELFLRKIPGVVSLADRDSMEGSLRFAECMFNNILSKEEAGRSVRVWVVDSPAVECMVRNGPSATIEVPIGALARLIVASRLMLKYWNKEIKAHFLNSPLDELDEKFWSVPSMLRPIFGSYFGNEAAGFWDDLIELNKSIDPDSRTEPDVLELFHLGIVYLASHEFSHYWQRHFDLFQLDLSAEELKAYGFTKTTLGNGIELHADICAAQLSMRILLGQLAADPTGSHETAFLRLGYVWTLLFSLYHPQRKYLYGYRDTRYFHPLVRRQLIAIHAHQAALRESEHLAQLFAKKEKEGWLRCSRALTTLNLDAMAGRFGSTQSEPVLLHLNPGGIASARHIDALVKEAFEQAESMSKLVLDLRDQARIH